MTKDEQIKFAHAVGRVKHFLDWVAAPKVNTFSSAVKIVARGTGGASYGK